jgi:hypothetical protein
MAATMSRVQQIAALKQLVSEYGDARESCSRGSVGSFRRAADDYDEIMAAIDQLAADQGSAETVPVPGAVWFEGGVSLINRGREDDFCARRPAQRIYFSPASSTSPMGEGEAV